MKQYEVGLTVEVQFMGTHIKGTVINQCRAYVGIIVKESSNPRLIEIGQEILVKPEEIMLPIINPRDLYGNPIRLGDILYMRSFEADLIYEVISEPYYHGRDCWAFEVLDRVKGDVFELYFAPDNSTLVCNAGRMSYIILIDDDTFQEDERGEKWDYCRLCKIETDFSELNQYGDCIVCLEDGTANHAYEYVGYPMETLDNAGIKTKPYDFESEGNFTHRQMVLGEMRFEEGR